MGLECSFRDIVPLQMTDAGVRTHSNHYVEKHSEDVVGIGWVTKDTTLRLARIQALIAQEGVDAVPSFESIERFLQDDDGFPTAICRAETEMSNVATLFSIGMDLGGRMATVKMGRPILKYLETLELRP